MDENRYEYKLAFGPYFAFLSIIILFCAFLSMLFMKSGPDWTIFFWGCPVLILVSAGISALAVRGAKVAFYPQGIEGNADKAKFAGTRVRVELKNNFVFWDQIYSVKYLPIPLMKGLKIDTEDGEITLPLNLTDLAGFKQKLAEFAPAGNPLRVWFEENGGI